MVKSQTHQRGFTGNNEQKFKLDQARILDFGPFLLDLDFGET